ncbi:MAG: hypothetical protein U1D31_02010 [Patescibacteria group bacterium]|nr:hypothetical protein [Patescibacteria group bacterium]
MQCLEITDHSNCIEFGPTNACNRSTYPFGEWAGTGIKASDSDNVLIKNLNIHGLRAGVHAGRLSNWTIENTTIANNSFVGWDGDIGANNSYNTGNIIFRNTKILYSGCGETYPGKQPYSCYSQSQGGYGDGIGTHLTGGAWVFENVDISHNVSDGLDLLYGDGTGSVTIQRSRFEGNAGNQVKATSPVTIENSVIIGNCGYFSGQSFTSTKNISGANAGFDSCRAAGNSISLSYAKPGTQHSIYNSTITGNGDVLVLTGGSGCNGSEKVISRNNIFVGGPQFFPGDTSDLYYAAGTGGNGDGACGAVTLDNDYSVIWGTKDGAADCTGKTNLFCQDPKFVSSFVQNFKGLLTNVAIQAVSPAVNKATVLAGKSSLDFNSFARGTSWDIGALEYASVSSTPTPVPTPTPTPTPAPTPTPTPTPVLDTTVPVISSFDVQPRTTTTGAVTATFSVTDTGGSYLASAKLYKALDNGSTCSSSNKTGCNWVSAGSLSAPASINSWSSTMTDTISSAGTYWYGLHVLDNAGNDGNEPAVIQVVRQNPVPTPTPAPTPTPTPAPAPAPTPETKFVAGDRVQVANGPLNVRASGFIGASLLGVQHVGALGIVIGGPASANGYRWWNINYDEGIDGWSAEDYLTKFVVQTPTPLPTPTQTPAPIDTSLTNLYGITTQIETLIAQLKASGVAARSNSEQYIGFVPLSSMRSLSSSSIGFDVFKLQYFLITQDKGVATQNLKATGATGYFGSVTKAALLEWQKSVGISPADGYFGPRTKTYLKSIGL